VVATARFRVPTVKVAALVVMAGLLDGDRERLLSSP
jgi:hypothetical protein